MEKISWIIMNEPLMIPKAKFEKLLGLCKSETRFPNLSTEDSC